MLSVIMSRTLQDECGDVVAGCRLSEFAGVAFSAPVEKSGSPARLGEQVLLTFTGDCLNGGVQYVQFLGKVDALVQNARMVESKGLQK